VTRAVLAAVLVLAGCQAVGDPDLPTLADRVTAARDRMHGRFTAAKATQLAIALGDLDRAHAEARRIAMQDEPDLRPEWQPYIEDIRRAATQITESADLVTAAKTMAQLGRECARCHEATQAKITFAPEAKPTDTPKLGSQMASHQWAAARMWEGVIGSSNERWLTGARALAGARLTITAESGELGIADDAARVKLLAQRAVKLGDPNDRATLYGELLATCAHCHATIRDPTRLPWSAARER